ncbi:type IV toxin-antitoxin system AbiEi family antitoxin domain-containing protein [Jiangella asiatica]|nr:type IV toxin-antitoxin system AbiEi family antitoxin domain-containing protein [Jiangella asiatica]
MPDLLRHVPDDIAELLARGHGIVHVTDARPAGVVPSRLTRLVRSGRLVRLAPGCYADTAAFDAEPPWERFRLRARAFALSAGPTTFLTSWAAVATWGLPTAGRPPERVRAVRSSATGSSVRYTKCGDIRIAPIPLGQARRHAGIGIMCPEWAVADAARSGPLPAALVAADAVARQGADLGETVRAMAGWPGVHRARWVSHHADPLAESPMETLGRFTCLQFGLPMPVSNAWVGADGPEFRVDGLWPHHGVVFEADGAVKYDNRPDASRIVARQGKREWRLRRAGLEIVRFGWDLAWRGRAPLARTRISCSYRLPARGMSKKIEYEHIRRG